MKEEKIIIGRRDKIDLPDFAIQNISAKIDTGAYTSSIHCVNAKVTGIKKKILTFSIVDPTNADVSDKRYHTHEFTEKIIRNSFGQQEKRYVIKTHILIFNQVMETQFSLSDRSEMRHPVLLGRKLLKKKFIVDVSKFNLSYKQKKKKKRRSQS
ncbi:MAG TPA: RimK/LysX family protein [Cytophagaceae bacterium]|jgi:hypothetical protein|nr:RimK/LysX family protein [Cytophagaceae bacterium]